MTWRLAVTLDTPHTRTFSGFIFALLAVLLVACNGRPAGVSSEAPRSVTLMLINDIYRINGIDGGADGGLARVRTLRRQLEQKHSDLLLLHAGDLLYPSLLSRRYDGEQMIDILNRLDGDAQAFDHNLFVTFGNHEFDKSKRKHAPLLASRIDASQFTWLSANIDFGRDADGHPLIAADHLLRATLIERGGLRIGLFGLTIDSKLPAYVEAIRSPLEVARRVSQQLRQEGADVVIALTHLSVAQDMALLRELGAEGPDLILGGHEHERQVHTVDGRSVYKADADALSAFVAHIEVERGEVRVRGEFHRLDGSVVPDAVLQQRIDEWEARHDHEYCAEIAQADDCLREVMGRTRVELTGEELQIRSRETNLGDWLLDRALEHYRPQGAQVAFINSGSLRLNQNLAAGSAITRRQLLELFAYPTPLELIHIDGATLQQVVEHAVSRWPGEGRWLQIAGFAWRHDTQQGRVDGLSLVTAQGARPIRPDEPILAVVNRFLLDPGIGDQDGYRMLNLDQRVSTDTPPSDLLALTLTGLRAAGEVGIAPRVEGRICTLPATVEQPCLALE